jgi:pantoate--beta-alanine ligase
VRESSGLALSSRNAYLTEAEKSQAALLYQTLLAGQSALQSGRRDYSVIASEMAQTLRQAGFQPDYFAIRRRADLGLPDAAERDLVILAAARLGRARLIDNLQCQI